MYRFMHVVCIAYVRGMMCYFTSGLLLSSFLGEDEERVKLDDGNYRALT